LGKQGVTSVLIEGGGETLGAAFDRRLVDEVHFYVAPLLCGGPDVIGGRGAGSTAESIRLQNTTYERIGDDLHLSGIVSSA
jgi:diaminohydroxyphosphoribosylaminopyrimidine deaminase/5-amino-6-(5-phosphoribosylamino)uracil reductase